MGYCRQTALPSKEPVSLTEAKTYCNIPLSVSDANNDAMITGFIQGAREYAENCTGRCLAQRALQLVLDSHPYYVDTIQTQQAYPPSYYSLPRYSTTLWNYSQMIKLPYPPLKSVQSMRYIAPDGTANTLNQDVDFVLDRINEPARIFPLVGKYWPPDLYVANAVQINYTAGYDPDPAAQKDVHTAGAAIGNVAIAGNVLTVTAPNEFVAGQSVIFSGLATATFLNGQTVTVLTASPTQFTAAFNHADYPGAGDSGTAALSAPGQQPDSTVLLAVPQVVRTFILMAVGHWYFNREVAVSSQPGTLPHHMEALLNSQMVPDFAPTRG